LSSEARSVLFGPSTIGGTKNAKKNRSFSITRCGPTGLNLQSQQTFPVIDRRCKWDRYKPGAEKAIVKQRDNIKKPLQRDCEWT
jgi:hypothetical protein